MNPKQLECTECAYNHFAALWEPGVDDDPHIYLSLSCLNCGTKMEFVLDLAPTFEPEQLSFEFTEPRYDELYFQSVSKLDEMSK